MLSPGRNVGLSLLAIALLALWGCSSTATKPESQGENAPQEAKQAAPSKPAEPAVESVPAKAEKPEAPVVEVIPQAATAETPIAMEPIPAKPAAAEPEAEAKQEAATSAAPQPGSATAAPPAEKKSSAKAASSEAAEQTPKSAPASPGPNQFIVTVETKDPSHPFYGKGHAMGFVLNGVQGKELVLERGKTYRFDIRTNAKHDVYISKKAIGWGGSPLAKGVEGAYTYKGVMTFTPGKDTPDTVYYACRNHPYMGGVIHIVDPGQSASVAVRPRQAAAAGAKPAVAKPPQITQAQARQRLMFAEMMANSQGTKRVKASQNAEAKKILKEASQSLAASREKLSAGAFAEALALADTSLKLIGDATRLVPSDEVRAEQATQYKELLTEIADYEASHEKNYARLSKQGKVSKDAQYDKAEVAALKAKAKEFADKGDYAQANTELAKVQRILTVAIHKMLDSQTIVYDLNFETPADEYEYELKRFAGYEELIPVAIEAKKPAPGAIKLMESFLEKARKRRDEAKERAAQGDYGEAIAMMQQATTTVRRALRMVGVTQ
jgi:HEPN domain-containing protein